MRWGLQGFNMPSYNIPQTLDQTEKWRIWWSLHIMNSLASSSSHSWTVYAVWQGALVHSVREYFQYRAVYPVLVGYMSKYIHMNAIVSQQNITRSPLACILEPSLPQKQPKCPGLSVLCKSTHRTWSSFSCGAYMQQWGKELRRSDALCTVTLFFFLLLSWPALTFW